MGKPGLPEIIIIAVLLIIVFGWKRLPDAARSLGRSARVFKSEVDQMKKDGTSDAARATVDGETVREPESPIKEDAPRTDNTSGPVA